MADLGRPPALWPALLAILLIAGLVWLVIFLLTGIGLDVT